MSQLPAWLPIGTTAPGATSHPWTTPAVVGFDYCVRLKGDAPGYTTSAYGTGAPFALVPELIYRIHLPVAFLNAVSP